MLTLKWIRANPAPKGLIHHLEAMHHYRSGIFEIQATVDSDGGFAFDILSYSRIRARGLEVLRQNERGDLHWRGFAPFDTADIEHEWRVLERSLWRPESVMELMDMLQELE